MTEQQAAEEMRQINEYLDPIGKYYDSIESGLVNVLEQFFNVDLDLDGDIANKKMEDKQFADEIFKDVQEAEKMSEKEKVDKDLPNLEHKHDFVADVEGMNELQVPQYNPLIAHHEPEQIPQFNAKLAENLPNE